LAINVLQSTPAPAKHQAAVASNSAVVGVMAQLTQEDLQTALKYHFSYDKFRPFQVEAIQACLAGRDSLLILPTGA
jgi:superfamily II DNA helicase RecQ